MAGGADAPPAIIAGRGGRFTPFSRRGLNLLHRGGDYVTSRCPPVDRRDTVNSVAARMQHPGVGRREKIYHRTPLGRLSKVNYRLRYGMTLRSKNDFNTKRCLRLREALSLSHTRRDDTYTVPPPTVQPVDQSADHPFQRRHLPAAEQPSSLRSTRAHCGVVDFAAEKSSSLRSSRARCGVIDQ